MTELQAAFEQMAARGNQAGAARVVENALTQAGVGVRRSRRAWFNVVAVAATVALVVTAASVIRTRVPHIERVDVSGALADGGGARGVMTVLVAGLDSRDGLDDPARRADAVMLLRVDRSTGWVSVLSLPRDLYVPIAGTGASERLATASTVGPRALVETVGAVTGIAIDHYLEFDFRGFAQVVDAAGGVDLNIPSRMRDELSGLALPAGCAHLDGATALAYVRARHVQYQDTPNGPFHSDPTGDIGRISRQQLLFLVALDQLPRDASHIDRVARAVADNVRADEGFSLRDAISFAKSWAQADRRLALLTYPATPASSPNGAAVLQPDTSQTASVIDAFAHPPADKAASARTGLSGASCG